MTTAFEDVREDVRVYVACCPPPDAATGALRIELLERRERIARAVVMRFEDTLPPGTEAEWTCGHRGGAVCAECYRLLAAKAHELAEEVLKLKEEVESLRVALTASRPIARPDYD